MTCREKLKQEHPDWSETQIAQTVEAHCPWEYKYLKDPVGCITNAAADIDCDACWDREIPEKDITALADCFDANECTQNGWYKIHARTPNGTGSDGSMIVDAGDPTDLVQTVYEKTDSSGSLRKKRRHRINGVWKEWTWEDPPANVGTSVSTIKDSGNRMEFATGAVRDMREGKGRCDLMPLEVASHYLRDPRANKDDQVLALIRIFQQTNNAEALYIALDEFNQHHGWGCDNIYDARCTMLLEVAKHFEEGAKKYGENNWQKGIPVHCYIDSAVRHYLKWLRGDKDEPHDRAFVWNLMCCIWEVDYREKKDE